jgi:hypothetical protein
VERCTVSRIYEGTNETNRMLAVEMLVKKGWKRHVNLLEPAMAVGHTDQFFDTPDYSQLFAEEKRNVS